MDLNNKKKFACDKCVYKTDKSSILKMHKKMVHDKLKDINCDQCKFICSSNGILKMHKKMVHDKIKDINCDQCKYVCSANSDLKMHKKRVHERPQESKRMSLGEYNIFTTLTNLNIEFKREFTFQDLLSNKGKALRFDFAIQNPKNNNVLLIEFDGAQHFQKVKWSNIDTEQQIKDRFEYIKICDKQKDKYAKDNKHSLLRIKYDDKDVDVIILQFLLSNQITLKLG